MRDWHEGPIRRNALRPYARCKTKTALRKASYTVGIQACSERSPNGVLGNILMPEAPHEKGRGKQEQGTGGALIVALT